MKPSSQAFPLHEWTINWYPWVNLLLLLLNRQQFLEPGESVLMISFVKKLQKLTSKKVQLILTDKPKLIYVDPAKLEIRGNIVWSDNPNELSVQVISPSNFKIFTVSHAFSEYCFLPSLFSSSISTNIWLSIWKAHCQLIELSCEEALGMTLQFTFLGEKHKQIN